MKPFTKDCFQRSIIKFYGNIDKIDNDFSSYEN